MSTVFRPTAYQVEALEKVRAAYREGKNRQLGHMATGLGKTAIGVFLPEYFDDLFEKYGMLVLVPRREIAMQFYQKLAAAYPSKRIAVEMGDNRANGDEDIIIMSPATTGRDESVRIEKFDRPFGIKINDEAHHSITGGINDNVLSWFGQGAGLNDRLPGGEKPLVLHLTATPNRADGKTLAPFCDTVAFSYGILWGVRNGYLTDIKAYQVVRKETPNITDPDEALLYEADVIVKAYRDFALDLKALVFAKSLDIAEAANRRFNEIGYASAYLDGTTPSEERDLMLKAHKRGDLRVLCNMGVLTEGYDDPSLQALVIARNITSDVLYRQIVGRVLRPNVNVYEVEDVRDRLAMIAESDKPFAHIIDIYDTTSTKDLNTVPTLFDLPAEFDANGSRIIEEVIDVIEDIESEQPERPIRDVLSMEDIKLAVRGVDVWSMTVHNEELHSVSPLRWIRDEHGVSLYLPENPNPERYSNGRVRPDDKTPRIIRIVRSSGDPKKFEVQMVDVGGWVKTSAKSGHTKRASAEVKDVIHVTEVESYMKKIDRWVVRHNPDIYKRVRRDFFEANAPATDEQKKKMKRLGIKAQDNVTAVTAQLLIDHHTIEKKMKALASGRQGTKAARELARRSTKSL